MTALVTPFAQLAEQARLADSGLALDRHAARRAFVQAREQRFKLCELLLAPHGLSQGGGQGPATLTPKGRFQGDQGVSSGLPPDDLERSEEHYRPMSAIEMQTQLQELQAERALASLEGLAHQDSYMADLDHEINVVRFAYVGAAVTEIATLRAQLSGPQVG